MRRTRRADKPTNGAVQSQVALRAATTPSAAALEVSELDRYRDLFERAPVGYVVTDATGRIERANRTCAEILGRSLERLEGRMLSRFVAPEERASFGAALTRAVAHGGTHDWPVRFRGARRAMVDTTVTVTVHERSSLEPTWMYWVIRFDRRWQEADFL